MRPAGRGRVCYVTLGRMDRPPQHQYDTAGRTPAWRSILGHIVVRHTRPLSLRTGRLRISHNLRAKLAFALFAGLGAGPVSTSAAEPPACKPRPALVRLATPLGHVGAKLTRHQPVTIVAIGSSSTWGTGASTRQASYPSRAQTELKTLFPETPISVLNQGVGGQEIPDMLKRFDDAVIVPKPDLVIWQLGTNSVIRDHMSASPGELIREGLQRIRAIGADIILIDPQFAPRVLAKPEAPRVVQLIAATAKAENVGLYPRFEVMKRWKEVDKLPFQVFTSPEGLHMNDWGYACLAKDLSVAIAEAATRPVLSTKTAAPTRP